MSPNTHSSQPTGSWKTLVLLCHACFTAVGIAILMSLTDGDYAKLALASFCGAQLLTTGVVVALRAATS